MLTPLAERIQEVDYPSFAPAGTGPYVSMGVTGCHPNFIERPDGSLMFSASMRYAEAEDYGQEDQSRPGIRDVLIRSTVRSCTHRLYVTDDPAASRQYCAQRCVFCNPSLSSLSLSPCDLLSHSTSKQTHDVRSDRMAGRAGATQRSSTNTPPRPPSPSTLGTRSTSSRRRGCRGTRCRGKMGRRSRGSCRLCRTPRGWAGAGANRRSLRRLELPLPKAVWLCSHLLFVKLETGSNIFGSPTELCG